MTYNNRRERSSFIQNIYMTYSITTPIIPGKKTIENTGTIKSTNKLTYCFCLMNNIAEKRLFLIKKRCSL